MKLRLRLFDAVVTPSALYGLTTAPLTAKDEEELAVTQRKMLRLIIGYVKAPEDSWADMCRFLRSRLARAVAMKPIREWLPTLKSAKRRLLESAKSGARNKLTCTVAAWRPDVTRDAKLKCKPARSRGRPRTVWFPKVDVP